MDHSKSVVTPARFASGMTFAQYLTHVGSPENLKREGTGGSQRPDNSAVMREWYGEAAPLDRDGQTFGKSADPMAEPGRGKNADIMAEFMNEKNGQRYQSIPVVVFYDRDLRYLYHYIELPAIYHKDHVVTEKIRAPRPGETPAQRAERAEREFGAFQKAPFFRMWAGR